MKTCESVQPLLRYPGGKFYALKLLRRFWSAVRHDEYREPFAGGATVFFDKPRVAHNWLNDMDAELMGVYRTIANEKTRKTLIARLRTETASPSRWKQVRDMTPTSQLGQAFKYYYLNRTSFSGKLISASWGYRPRRSLPPERWEERLLPCGKKIENVKLTTGDFQHVIESRADGKAVLLYVDPPYYAPPRRKHYRNGFTAEDHHRLAEALKGTSHKFFLTYDDVPQVRSMYEWANIHELKFFYRVGNSNTAQGRRTRGCELVITNYKLPTQEHMEDFPYECI
ncbi:MAG: DNA adenine methylase [Euryarchaeota archaeon]|nr:DNA adenine methylase [Euryarchaeota archaeon]